MIVVMLDSLLFLVKLGHMSSLDDASVVVKRRTPSFEIRMHVIDCRKKLFLLSPQNSKSSIEFLHEMNNHLFSLKATLHSSVSSFAYHSLYLHLDFLWIGIRAEKWK